MQLEYKPVFGNVFIMGSSSVICGLQIYNELHVAFYSTTPLCFLFAFSTVYLQCCDNDNGVSRDSSQ